jgi:hypothetical protein
MGLITGLVLLALGVLAASSVIVANKPDAEKYIEMLRPYQGWVGFVACLWGVWTIIVSILNLNWLTFVPLWWISYALAGVLLAGLGFLSGYPLLSQYLLSKNAEAQRQGEAALARLTPYQINLGYAGIALGIWLFVARFIWAVG